MEDDVAENTPIREVKEKNIQKMNSFRSLWDNIKCANILIMEMLKGEEKEQGIENIFEEIMMGDFSSGEGNIQTRPGGTESPK